MARWFRARPVREATRLAALIGGPVDVRLVGIAPRAFDPYAAYAEVRAGGASFAVAGSSAGMRAIAQRL
ncbi:MAG: hypothetical protein KF773_33335, partial [Deltaproteobacteria bacterium]|nr:hypothetical protein [Deltaproteobacteria bacterium]